MTFTMLGADNGNMSDDGFDDDFDDGVSELEMVWVEIQNQIRFFVHVISTIFINFKFVVC